MTLWTLGVVRRATALILVSVVTALVALLAMLNLAPFLGHHTYPVRGPAMEPTLPVGTLVIVRAVAPAELAVGDIVTFQADDRLLTRRISALPDGASPEFSVRADADDAPEALSILPSAIVGRVEASVPVIGAIVVILADTTGVLGTLGLVGGLLMVGWTIDEQIAMRTHRRRDELAWSAS